jgi:hypothetical protein
VSIPIGIHRPMLATVSAAMLIAVTLPIAACGSSSSPSSATSGASTAGLTDCFSHTVVQPKSFILACADESVTALRLVWHGWGQATSIGRGIISYRTCNPTCAQGTQRQASVVIAVTRLQVCPDGRKRYTRLAYNYSGNTAGPVTMTDTCPPYQP